MIIGTFLSIPQPDKKAAEQDAAGQALEKYIHHAHMAEMQNGSTAFCIN